VRFAVCSGSGGSGGGGGGGVGGVRWKEGTSLVLITASGLRVGVQLSKVCVTYPPNSAAALAAAAAASVAAAASSGGSSAAAGEGSAAAAGAPESRRERKARTASLSLSLSELGELASVTVLLDLAGKPEYVERGRALLWDGGVHTLLLEPV
jgi:hypothetical protein